MFQKKYFGKSYDAMSHSRMMCLNTFYGYAVLLNYDITSYSQKLSMVKKN